MNGISRIVRAVGGAALALGAFLVVPGPASASHKVYPPGWNQPVTSPPNSTVVFRSGCGWGDYKEYWADQSGCGTPKPHSMTYGPVIYQMNPQGERYHRVD